LLYSDSVGAIFHFSGALDKILPGGWSVVKLQYPFRGPKVVVDSDHLSNLERSEYRSDSRLVVRGKCSAKSLDAVFMNAYKKVSARACSSLGGAPIKPMSSRLFSDWSDSNLPL
jgi:hypothetical protein